MGTTDKGKAIFVMNAGKTESDITDNSTSFDYGDHASKTTEAYLSTSVNPIFVQNNLQYENSVAGSSLKNSVNFVEIRKTSRKDSISNDIADKIGNRLLPTNTTITSYARNKDETPSHKIKVYDSASSDGSEINRRFTYATSNYPDDYPSTDEVGLDVENYDYFILINPEMVSLTEDISDNTVTTVVRPHFAKITRIVTFDVFGDGVEFTPKYRGTIPNNANFEIFKGPAKTDTDVVAVSYGLRGDDDADTPKYDNVNICSRPTWYFYNDRLDEKDQLDYMTKYTATHLRWWNYSTNISITEVKEHTQFAVGSNTVKFITSGSSDTDKLSVGMSLFNASDAYLGNIESISSNDVLLDFARIAISATTSDFNVKVGKTIQNVIFRTEAKFGKVVQNLGKNRLDATLVDNNLISDDANSSDFYRWDNAFPKMQRHLGNLQSPSATGTFDNNLTGPVKYITFEKANFKNNRIPLIQESTLNNPRNKMSQLAQVVTLDNHGLQHLKVKEEADMVIETNIHNESLLFIEYEGHVDSISSPSKFRLEDIREENDLRHILSSDDIVMIDDYLYVIDTVSAPSSETQDFTIKAKKLKNANTWTITSTVENISGEKLKLPPYTGVINTSMLPDTEIDYATQRLTIDGNTVEKAETKLFDARFVLGNHPSHVNKVDSGDKDNKFLKMQDANRVFYQRRTSNSTSSDIDYNVDSGRVGADRFYYYNGAYNISDVVFNGIIEDITSESKHGMTSFKIVARDESSKMLSKSVSLNTNVTSDIVHSTILPLVTNTTDVGLDGGSLTVSGGSSEITGNLSIPLPVINSILVNQVGELIGEVKGTAQNYLGFGSIDKLTTYEKFDTPTTTTAVKELNPTSTGNDDSTHISSISAVKALQSNPNHSVTSSDLGGLSDNGLIFNDGLKINGVATGVVNTSSTFTKLERASNTGTFDSDGTLGFDISSPKAIGSNDSTFAIQIGNENGVSIDKEKIAILASETFDVVAIDKKEEGNTSLFLAPQFPVVLGRIETNSSDSRGNTSLYLVNRNINTGGFIHRLADTFSGTGYYAPQDTMRYWDLQEFAPGTITRTFDSIYNEGKSPQKIQGYAVASGVKASGAITTVSETPSAKPLAGSNTIKGWTYKDNFYGSSTLIESYDYFGDSEADIDYDAFEQIDPRAQPYELLAVGDLYPYSHLRYNNMGFHNRSFDEFGIILESESTSTGTTTHQNYTGKTTQTKKTDNMFEDSSIASATVATNQTNRWGVMRLVEATFDWHFNPVDFHSLKHNSEIPLVRYFDYVMFAIPTSPSGTITVDSGGDVTAETVPNNNANIGSIYYDTDSIGSASAIAALPLVPSGLNGYIARKKTNTDGTGSTNWGANSLIDTIGVEVVGNNLLRFDGANSGNTLYFNGVERFRLFRDGEFGIDNLNTRAANTDMRTNLFQGDRDIRWTDAFILRPAGTGVGIRDGYDNLRYALLDDNDSTNDNFDPHNIILPLISEERSGATNRTDRTFSMFHVPNSWAESVGATSGNFTMLHMSRVIAGLVDRNFSHSTFGSQTSAFNFNVKYGMGITNTSSTTVAHIYDNCIGVFKDVRGDNGESIPLTSTPLALDTDSNYTNYLTNVLSETDHDQHSRNLMIQTYGSDSIAMCGTKSDSTVFMQNKSGSRVPVSTSGRPDDHNSVASTATGSSFSGQMIVKPTFDLTGESGTSVTFTLNKDTTHAFLSFMPNLKGYYLVSEELTTDKTIREQFKPGSPRFITKILTHTISTAPTSSAIEAHTITFDRTLDVSTNGVKYRLMRVAETTFDETPDKIEFNVMRDDGLRYDMVSTNFKTGGEGGTSDMVYHEGVYSMYLLLEIDNTADKTFLEKRTGTAAVTTFTNNEVLDMYVTDGNHSERKKITVGTTKKKGNSSATESILSFSYDGTLTGNGVVSFGEIFELQLGRKPKLDNIKKCHIGTTFSVGSNVETELENIAESVDLEYDATRSFSTKTGNVVNSTTSNTVVCTANVKNLSVGDVVFSHEGHLIGEVQGISSATITFTTNLLFTPLQYDELTLENKKTFVTNIKFDDVNVFDAVNSLVAKRGLDYNVKHGKLIARNIEDTASLRKYSMSYKESERLISVKSNKSMFDKANKVIVIGDKVKFELAQPTKKQERTVKVVDPSIKTVTDAQVRAVEILKLHSEDVRKITLTVQKKGLELLEAGDIVSLNFPNHNIPNDDYIVFEIENVLSGTMTITVGTFDKTIAERLSEITVEQANANTTSFKRDSIEISSGQFLFDELKLNVVGLEYEITGNSNALSYNSNMGFDDLLGFTEQVGFATSIVTKKEFKDRFYEQGDEV